MHEPSTPSRDDLLAAVDGDEGALHVAAERWMVDVEHILDAIRHAHDEMDGTSLGEGAHALATAARRLNGRAVIEAAGRLEELARAGRLPPEAAAVVDRLEEACLELTQALSDLLGRRG